MSRSDSSINILGITPFDQCVLNMALINICNQHSEVGQEMLQAYRRWRSDTDEPSRDPWLDLHWFTIYVPHPDQTYEGITLADGLSMGYNIDVKPVDDRTQIPYDIPEGGHFVAILKQYHANTGFEIAATGIFVRPLAVMSLDIVTDRQEAYYQPVVVKHPIVREYPGDLEERLRQFMARQIHHSALSPLVKHVDQAFNTDYRSPNWNEVYLTSKGFAGV